ncbi:MAG: hypothetical protein MI862_16965 [Desulfobacterales bacterium]|nr:hypothetical protein [Desulfobacterales bacterium]
MWKRVIYVATVVILIFASIILLKEYIISREQIALVSFKNGNFKYSISSSYPFKNEEKTMFLKVESNEEVTIKIWILNILGTLDIILKNANDNIYMQESGKNIDKSITLSLKEGEYQLSCKFQNTFMGAYVIGLKNVAAFYSQVTLDPKHFTEVEPNPGEGFNWPFLLYVPENIEEDNIKHLLVITNNTGSSNDNFTQHLENAKKLILKESKMAKELQIPLIVPVFPRTKTDWHIYTHALDRDSLITEKEDINRLDLQLIKMIESARKVLSKNGIKTHEKVLMSGFSASAMFANRFTLLHPELVEAISCGAPGGWPIIPIERWQGYELRYPIGIGDLQEIVGYKPDIELIKKIPMFFYLGEKDTNDSVTYRDGYEKEDEEIIFNLFGENPVERWEKAENIYSELGCSSEFLLYKGVGHQKTFQTENDIIRFFKTVINK